MNNFLGHQIQKVSAEPPGIMEMIKREALVDTTEHSPLGGIEQRSNSYFQVKHNFKVKLIGDMGDVRMINVHFYGSINWI